MDDYGNALHWTNQFLGFRSMGLFGFTADDIGIRMMMCALDLYEAGA